MAVVAVLLFVKKTQVGGEARVNNEIPIGEQRPQKLAPVDPDPEKKKILACVNGWLEAQKKGDRGVIYWDSFDNLKSLFAVRSWEILLENERTHPITVFESKGHPTALVKVRIDSSTKGGISVSKIWTLSMRKTGNDWKIESLYGQNPGDD